MKTRKYGIPKSDDAIDRLYKVDPDLLADEDNECIEDDEVEKVDFDTMDLVGIFDHIERYGLD